MTAPRPLPGRVTRCRFCGRDVVYALTVAGPNGPGGKWQLFDPHEHPDGRVAIIPLGGGRLRARALHKGETHDATTELLGMPHVATCQPSPVAPEKWDAARLPENVTDLTTYRARNRR